MTIRVERDFYRIRVYFDDVLHVHVDARRLIAVYNWKDEYSYWVEYILDGGCVSTEYDTREKWLAVLAELEKVL